MAVGIVRGFLLDVLVKAAVTRAVTALPFLGWPIIGPLFAWCIEYAMMKWIYPPIRDELMLRDIARENFENHEEFNKAYLKVKLIDKVNLNPAEQERILNEAHNALDKFALYQRRSIPA